MEYLNRVLGIHTDVQPEAIMPMPNYINARYRLQRVTLNGKAAVFVYPIGELDAINVVKKHLERIERTENAPAVLVFDRLTSRQKEYLLRDHVPFVVDGKQIYLPFMAVYLQERGDREKPENTKILPSAQILLLYYIYNGCGELMTSKAAKALRFTATSISRASRQLAELGLIETHMRGVQKVIRSDKSPEAFFLFAKDSLQNPVKKTLYVPKEMVPKSLPLSGYSALSAYSMMNPPSMEYRAVASVATWERVSSMRPQNQEDQCAVQLWRYDPRKLADGRCVDRLSLALALDDEQDERIEEAVEKMLEQTWREIHDQRN